MPVTSIGLRTQVGAVYHDLGKDTWGIQNRMGVLFFVLVYLTLLGLSSLPLWRQVSSPGLSAQQLMTSLHLNQWPSHARRDPFLRAASLSQA